MSTDSTAASKLDWRLELVQVPVADVDRAKAFYIQAEHIPATKHFFYAVWLYNSHTSALPLSKSPPVGKSHKLAGAALLHRARMVDIARKLDLRRKPRQQILTLVRHLG